MKTQLTDKIIKDFLIINDGFNMAEEYGMNDDVCADLWSNFLYDHGLDIEEWNENLEAYFERNHPDTI